MPIWMHRTFLRRRLRKRGEDHDLRLLDVGFEIVDKLERRQNLLQRNRAYESDLAFEVVAWNEVLTNAGGLVQNEILQRLINVSS